MPTIINNPRLRSGTTSRFKTVQIPLGQVLLLLGHLALLQIHDIIEEVGPDAGDETFLGAFKVDNILMTMINLKLCHGVHMLINLYSTISDSLNQLNNIQILLNFVIDSFVKFVENMGIFKFTNVSTNCIFEHAVEIELYVLTRAYFYFVVFV